MSLDVVEEGPEEDQLDEADQQTLLDRLKESVSNISAYPDHSTLVR